MDAVEPRQAESVPVMLTRMEGKLDNVVEKVSDLRAEVTLHRGQIVELQSRTQQIQSDLVSAEQAAVRAAAAVREADEARVAAAKAEVDSSTRRWTPWQRFFAIVGTVVTVTSFLAYLWTISH